MEARERIKAKRKIETIGLDDSDTENEGNVTKYEAKKSRPNGNPDPPPAPVEATVAASNPLAAIFGDRAQMEKERLERQRKRREEAGLPKEEEDEEEIVEESGSTKIAKSSVPTLQKPAPSRHENGSQSNDLYWNGAIKKSFNQFSPHLPGTPFSQFLLPATPFHANGLRQVIMATFCADPQWLASLFPKAPAGKGPNITFICLEENGMRSGVYSPLHPDMPNWVRLVVPRKGLTEFTTMHMKFMMLFFEDRLRLMILSGNLLEYDWKTIENTAFIHDFPKLAQGQQDNTSEYSQQMRMVLKSLSVPQNYPAMRMMSTYDMRSPCEARIVASIPNMKPLSGWTEISTVGLGRLSLIVREIMNGKIKSGVTIEAQGSSMGTYSTRWLQQLHIVASGNKLEGVIPLPSGKKADKVWAQAVSQRESEKWPPIKLLFPSDRWVKTQSIQGPDGALTFFGKSKQSVERGFIDVVYQPVSIRGNIMMHHKAMLALQIGSESNQGHKDAVIGWAYMGSHNLTQAAWGNISQAKESSEPQCTIGNWELGVVMPVRQADLDESQLRKESLRMAANVVTWQRPVEKYKKGDIPWDQFNQ